VLARLRERYASVEEYLAFWRAHPATGPYWNDAIENYARTDLFGEPPALEPGSRAERVGEDMLDMFNSVDAPDPLDGTQCRAVVVRAPRGLLDDPGGLYPEGYLQTVAATHPLLEVIEVEDINHYTILLEQRAATVVAEAVREICASLAAA
jgi:hypothetical protein